MMAVIGFSDLIDEVASETGQPKTIVNTVLSSLLRQMKCDLLWHGHSIAIKGFGAFKVVDTQPRKGRNPRTGEELLLPASRRLRFSASKMLAASEPRKT